MDKHLSSFAYVHARPVVDSADVFYVGKGTKKRVRNLTTRSAEHRAVTAAIGLDAVLIGTLECSSQEIAFELERGLIKRLHSSGAVLVNKTLGGGGAAGFQHSEEARHKISAAKMGAKNPMKRPEVAAKVSKNTAARRPEVRAKVAATRALPEQKLKESLIQQQTWSDPEIRARRTAWNSTPEGKEVRGRHAKRFRENNPSSTPEGKLLRSAQSKIRWQNPAMRAQISESISQTWTDERKSAFSRNNPSHDPAINAKKSAALKGYVWPRAVCPHCSAEGSSNIMRRWHFDRCKKIGGVDADIS